MTTNKPVIDPNAGWFNWIADQLCHFLIGYSATLTLDLKHMPLTELLGVPIFATLKEYGWDSIMENAGFWNNTIDFSFYLAGWITALWFRGRL